MTTENGARESLEGIETFLSVLLRHRRRLLFFPPIIAFVLALILYLMPREYSVVVVFQPSSQGGSSALAGLAAQAGLAIPGGGSAAPRVFAEVLKSNQVVREAVLHRYSVQEAKLFGEPELSEGTLVEFYEIDEEWKEKGIQKAMERLSKNMSVTVDDVSGLVRLRVTTKWPSLSFGIVDALLVSLERYNLENRQTLGRAERVFVEGRLQEAMANLRVTEDSLQQFLQRNRQFRDSPVLVFENDRLQRSVTLRQQVVLTLTQALEQARVSEVRDTPLFAVVSQPLTPAKHDRRNMLLKAIGLYVVLLGFGIIVAFVSEIARMAGGTRAPEGELRRLLTETKEELTILRDRVLFLRSP